MGSIFGGKKSPGPQLSTERIDFRQDVLDRTRTSRDSTLKLITELEAQAKGEGPSLGTQQLASTQARSLAQTLAAASAQRGPGIGGARRQFTKQQGDARRNIAEQGDIIQQQERQAAQDQLGQLALQQQQEDLQQIMQPGSVVASAEAKRFDEALRQSEIDSQRRAREGAALFGGAGAIAGGLLGGPTGAQAGGQAGGIFGSALGQASSDKRLKKDVKSADKDIAKFLEAISAKKFRYKDTEQKGTAPGQRFGVMAQDLEKSPMGKSLVANTPQGKMVNTTQGFGALLAAQADLHDRLKKLETKKRKS